MDESTWTPWRVIGGFLALAASALGLLKRTRAAASTDDDLRYKALKRAFDDLEREMNRSFGEVRDDIEALRSEHRQDKSATDARWRQVRDALESMEHSWQTFRTVVTRELSTQPANGPHDPQPRV